MKSVCAKVFVRRVFEEICSNCPFRYLKSMYWCFVHVKVGFLQSPVNDRMFGHYSRILKFRFGAVRLITKNGS